MKKFTEFPSIGVNNTQTLQGGRSQIGTVVGTLPNIYIYSNTQSLMLHVFFIFRPQKYSMLYPQFLNLLRNQYMYIAQAAELVRASPSKRMVMGLSHTRDS